MILDIGFETMPREDLEAIILRRLKATIDRVYANVAFYRKKFEEKNIRFSLNKKTAGLKPTASKKKTTGFFFRLPMVFNKLVLFYLAGPWIDFFKKKSSKKLKKPK